jgi:single-stranded DNA-specific DHH superfamily exonuclease
MFFLEKDRKHDGLMVNELNQINEKRKKLIEKIRKSD